MTKDRLFHILTFILFISLSLHSFSQVNKSNQLSDNYLDDPKYSIYSIKDTLVYDNKVFLQFHAIQNSSVQVFINTSGEPNALLMIIPDSFGAQLIWYSNNVSAYRLLDLNNDQQSEIVIENEYIIDSIQFHQLFIVSFARSHVDTLFYTNGFSYLKTVPEEVDMLSKAFFYKIKDYNKDRILDLKIKTIRKYPKDRKCDCDKNHFYRIRKEVFYFNNGKFTE